MSETPRRSTIYFESGIYTALRVKAAQSHRSVSQIVNDAVRRSLAEDQQDLATFEQRMAEPELSYEQLLSDLKAHGKL
jgi:plasmid stability protein